MGGLWVKGYLERSHRIGISHRGPRDFGSKLTKNASASKIVTSLLMEDYAWD